MKKRIYFAIICGALAFALNSCSDACKTCQKVKYDKFSGDEISSESAQEYCGLELITIEATGDVEIGDYVYRYDCY